MEVDDAIEMAQPVKEKTVLDGGISDDGIDDSDPTTPNTSASANQKRAKLKHDNEEPPGGIEIHSSDSILTATPFKLEVSGSEDEIEGDSDGCKKIALRRKLLLSTPLDEDTKGRGDALEELKEVSIKRKRYEVSRSGYEDYLIGFDEETGEAEFVNAETIEKPIVTIESSSNPTVDQAVDKSIENASEKTESQLNTSQKSKKISSPTKVASPVLQPARSASKSPKYVKPKTPPVEIHPVSKVSAHIVADGEETNGVVTSPSKSTFSELTKKPLSSQDDFYKKPFDFGWKRELVWRANPEISKDKADVYFISPAGKKLRARNEILPLLEGDLTIDHFCFLREPLGASPEVEIVRSAKPTSRSSVTAATLAAAPTPPNIGKRVSKPKGPKGASPPPQGWTPSKALKVNNAALLSSSGSNSRSTATYTVPSTPPSSRKQDNAHAHAAHSTKSVKTKKHVNDIENDLKQINESIRKNRKQSNNSQDGSLHTPNSQNSLAVEHSNKLFATNLFANVSYAYDSLLCILKYLKIHERPRAAAVCKLWNLAAKDTSLWQTVRMKNSKVCNWLGFAAALRRGETKHLDLRKMLLPSGRSEDMWNDFCANIGTVYSLENIDLCRCSARVVESLFQSNQNLKVINALAINDDTINLEHIALLQFLEELRLRTCEAGVLSGDLTPIASLSKLTHLSLTSIKGLGAKSVEMLGELATLKSLELGECGDFDTTFAEAVLPKLINLQRLRLENSQVTNVCTLEILDAVARLVQLNQLELVNFDIKPGFDEKLSLCMNISKLLIIPTYISQSATTNQIVLSAVQQVSETLKVFTWCVTVELLRVTALYVDQCEESTKKEKHHFDECIPVLKPVPGANAGDEEKEVDRNKPKSPAITEDGAAAAAAEVPQIEILPLDKVESILAENLPLTKFTIVKVPYHATCKQQLVDLN